MIAQASRRGFLRGLGALLAAPSIVRVASLMPISVAAQLQPITVANPNGYLTIQMITREAVRLWGETNSYLAKLDGATQLGANDGPTAQSGVDFLANHGDHTWTLEDYSARHIAPAIAALKSHVGDARLFLPGAIPRGVAAAAIEDHLRAIQVYNIDTDTYMTRLDVRYKPKS